MFSSAPALWRGLQSLMASITAQRGRSAMASIRQKILRASLETRFGASYVAAWVRLAL
jgi:hypothetical protein